MQVLKSGVLQLQNEADIVYVRQAVRKLTQEVGLGLVDQTKLITAASELARNTVKYAGQGTMRWDIVANQSGQGVRLCFEDQGPGIADVSLAMRDGWTSGGGLGLGLSGAKRLVNEFEIQSAPNQGTRVTITRWK